MARLVYFCRFDVAAEDGIASVVATYKDWIVEHYRSRRGLPDFDFDPEAASPPEGLPDDHSLISQVYEHSGERVVRIRWSSPDDTDAGLMWAHDIRTGQFGDRCGVEHLISIGSAEYSVTPARLKLESPRAVHDICAKVPAYIGEMRVWAEPDPLKQDGLDDLLDLLTSDLRRLPVVLLSPYASGELNQIDPARLARNLAGLAVVVPVDDRRLTWDFGHKVGRELSCFDGAARIYWPGFSKESNWQDHRLFFGAWIEKVGPAVAARTIKRTIFAVAAFRHVPDKRISDLIRRDEAAKRQKRLEQRKQQAGDEFWGDYQQTVDELRDVKEQNADLAAENANLRANQKVFFTRGAAGIDELTEPEDTEEPSFSSVLKAVEAAKERCKNVEILDTAISAAKESSFKRPDDVFEALTDLDEIVDAWKKNRDETRRGRDLLEHLSKRGWGKRASMHISPTTLGRYRSDYEFMYQGRKQLFEPHITIGARNNANSCMSIHFIFDHERPKMVVAYVGKHLRNTKSN